jgi:LPS-assembly protein
VSTTTASLDSGLIFERDTAWGGHAFTQTLEPRLFYLRTTRKDQDALPVFDTALADFSFASLFRENRFSGGDRVGDANQLTAAITTRFIDGTNGAERLRLSLGQTRYFEDRLVNLPAGTADRESSDYAAEAIAWLGGHWHVRGALQWNPEAGQSEKRNYYAQYQPAPNKILTFGHRFVRDEVDQADITTEWPLTTYWTLHARSLYSLRDDRNMESYIGAEYGTCCWAFRLFVKQRFAETRDEFDNVTGGRQVNSILFQLELTGLSKLGTAPTTPLKEGLFYPWRDRYSDSSSR